MNDRNRPVKRSHEGGTGRSAARTNGVSGPLVATPGVGSAPRHDVPPRSLASDLMASPGQHLANDSGQIPDIVIRRLPIYVRTLKALRDREVASVSSEELADLIGVTAAQIRRDLSYFGKFGKQGKGYDTEFLAAAIGSILRLDRQWPVALVGLGHLGRAIANYRGFTPSSFTIVSLFDRNPRHIGDVVNEMTIQPESELVESLQRDNIRIGIIATPKVHAQETADLLVEGGIEAILNYAPVILKVPDYVTVREIDPVSALQSITYYISKDGVPSRS
ncbi:MAG: redox-sensing transcriptional repressor Rex [Thermomicrobiales bacterium]